MRKLTLATVLASALLVVSNIASAAIVNTTEGGFSYKNVEKSKSIIVTVERADDAKDWQYGIYYTRLNGTESFMSGNLAEGSNYIVIPTDVQDVGVWAVNGGGNLSAPGVAKHVVYSFVNNKTNPGFNFSMTEVGSNTFVFGKNGGVKGSVSVFGAPLPTPVVTLLIALGLGAAFVLYRNRKQQAEA